MKRQLLRTGISWLVLLVFMVVCQPSQLPVIVLIVPFVLLFTGLFSLWGLLQMLYERFITKKQGRRHRRLGAMVCGSAVLLVILQSLGQLTLRDAGTVAAIAVIGYLYVARNRLGAERR